MVRILKNILKNKISSKIYEVFDFKEAYVNVVDGRLLISSRNLMKF
jgi:hypothetical protein